MSTIVVKNFPDDLHGLLRERAERNHRSMTKEVVHLIAAGLGSDLPVQPRSLQTPHELTNSPSDGRETLRAALIKQPDGSYVNVLGMEDGAFFDTLDRIRSEAKVRDVSHLFDDTP